MAAFRRTIAQVESFPDLLLHHLLRLQVKTGPYYQRSVYGLVNAVLWPFAKLRPICCAGL